MLPLLLFCCGPLWFHSSFTVLSKYTTFEWMRQVYIDFFLGWNVGHLSHLGVGAGGLVFVYTHHLQCHWIGKRRRGQDTHRYIDLFGISEEKQNASDTFVRHPEILNEFQQKFKSEWTRHAYIYCFVSYIETEIGSVRYIWLPDGRNSQKISKENEYVLFLSNRQTSKWIRQKYIYSFFWWNVGFFLVLFSISPIENG